MTTLIIEKDGTISEKQIKSFDKLYSICGYRTNKDFEKLHEWTFDENVYELYGKKCGKKDKLNSFPLPLNETKYYGSLCVLKKGGSITLNEWNMFYMSFTSQSNIHEHKEIQTHSLIQTKIKSSMSKKIKLDDTDTYSDCEISDTSDYDDLCEDDFDIESNDSESITRPIQEPTKFEKNHEFELTYEDYEEES